MSPYFDLDSLEVKLRSKLENLHKEGSRLRAQCPNCKGSGRSFYTSRKVNFKSWNCHSCGHTVPTAQLLGGGLSNWTTDPRPTVADYKPEEVDLRQIADNRLLYESLVNYAHDLLMETDHALAYVLDRGVTLDQIVAQKIGFISAKHYRLWYSSLDYTTRARLHFSGLPELKDRDRLPEYARMFAGGRKGKIVIPYLNAAGQVEDLRTRSISDADKTSKGKQSRYVGLKGSPQSRRVTIPYGAGAIGNAQRVILTEGEIAALLPISWEIPALGLRGTNDWLPEYFDLLRDRFVILAFDNDTKKNKQGFTAGQGATVNIGRKLRANGIDVGILDPAKLGAHKGTDDFINAEGAAAFAELVAPGATITLAEFEAKLTVSGIDVKSIFTQPKADPGTRKYYADAKHIDRDYHADIETVDLDTGQAMIEEAVEEHLNHWRKGNKQLMIRATAGLGKTTTAARVANTWAKKNKKTVAFLLPTHDTVDEKINDGTLPGYGHMHGRRWDNLDNVSPSIIETVNQARKALAPEGAGDYLRNDGTTAIRNCISADSAQMLTEKGYSAGGILCPDCPVKNWCDQSGYKSQFKGKGNRAYSHGHVYSDYPSGEDLVIVDEFTHKQLIGDMRIQLGDVVNTLNNAAIKDGPRRLLEGLLNLYHQPHISDLSGFEFYETLERYFNDLRNIESWADAAEVQGALVDLAKEFALHNAYQIDQLPDAFGLKLFAMLADDMRRILAGHAPTGRIRFVVHKNSRHIELTYNKGLLPEWYAKKPVIILNATGDPELLEGTIGELKTVTPTVEIAEGNEIIQDLTRNNAKSNFLGSSPEAEGRRAAWFKQINGYINDESDTLIVGTKATAQTLATQYPKATVAYYGALEGRNDLEKTTTILANAPAVNLEAVKREAAALYPGINTTMARRLVSFDYADAEGKRLAVEQIDAVDPKVQRILDQHRDAAAVQALHRSRIVRRTGRRVIALFARPIPGIKPTQHVTERSGPPSKTAIKKADTIEGLATAAAELAAQHGGYTAKMLTERAKCSPNTARKYWNDITQREGLNHFEIAASQPLANGGTRAASVKVAIRADIAEAIQRLRGTTDGRLLMEQTVNALLPAGWALDLAAMGIEIPDPPIENVECTEITNVISNIITPVIYVHSDIPPSDQDLGPPPEPPPESPPGWLGEGGDIWQ